jgi:peroxiredoxin
MKKLLIFFLLLGSAAFALDTGDKATAFSLPDTAGKTVNLSDFSGKNVVVIFVATKCPFSNAFNKVMTDLAKDYSSKDVVLIGINSNKTEPAEEVASHAKQNLPFTVLKDAENKIADAYKASVTPEAFVIDTTGTIRYHGALGNSTTPTKDAAKANSKEIREALDALLSGKEIAKSKTKAFGCTIKRV